MTTTAGYTRLLIPDLQAVPDQFFTDDQINDFVTLGSDNPFRAAALAVGSIARDQVLILKFIRTLQLQTNGPAVGAELRMQAEKLTARAEEWDAEQGGSWAIAEQVNNQFDYRERLVKEYLRAT